MLNVNDLLCYDEYPQSSDISLELYRDFSQTVLMNRKFFYTFEDGTNISIIFTEYGIYHMLGIQHIDNTIRNNDFFNQIDNGLSLASFSANRAIKMRYKGCKSRIRMFACIYQTLRSGRFFYCPNGKVVNTASVMMDYIIYREISQKGLNIGIRNISDDNFVPLTILVSKAVNPTMYIDNCRAKIVKSLEISDINTGAVIENILYTDELVTSI